MFILWTQSQFSYEFQILGKSRLLEKFMCKESEHIVGKEIK